MTGSILPVTMDHTGNTVGIALVPGIARLLSRP